jgi:hypothetical protein
MPWPPAICASDSWYSGIVEAGLARLAADLESGAWERRHRDLLELEELSLGYYVVVAELAD